MKCLVCGENMIIGSPTTLGSIGTFSCPYLSKNWHIEAAKDPTKQHPTLHLQQRRKDTKNVMPEGQGKRDARRPRHDLIPIEWLDELASIFEEGLPKYGDSWKKGGPDFLIDCLNHASNHLHKYMNGDESENQLAKVAWNCLAVRWHKLKEKKDAPGSV